MRPIRKAVSIPLIALTVLALSAAKPAAKLNQQQQIEHALARLTYGPRPGDAAAVERLGLKKWIELQLHPERIPQDPRLEERLAKLETLRMKPAEVAAEYPLPNQQPKPPDPAEQQALRRKLLRATPEERRALMKQAAPVRTVYYDLAESKVQRALYSTRQLEEVLTGFWFNHFNVHFDKGADRYLVTAYERDAIRPHVLGKFGDMLRATAGHPAMLFYLDNWQSVDPEAIRRVTARQRKQAPPKQLATRGINENYARELMELHTLGVDGGYTQKDVQEVARCFTGWTIDQPRRGGEFVFRPLLHDPGEKTVLGEKIPAGGGKDDGLKVLDLLAHHPSTARFISHKLAVRFVSDNPPKALVDRMAKEFSKTGGDLRAVMKTMLDSKEFWSEEAYRAKVKSPLEFAISAARAVEADVNYGFGLAEAIGRMGMPLYRKQEPTGYPDSAEEWVNSSGLLARLNFATSLAENRLPGVRVDAAKYGSLGQKLGGPEFQKR